MSDHSSLELDTTVTALVRRLPRLSSAVLLDLRDVSLAQLERSELNASEVLAALAGVTPAARP